MVKKAQKEKASGGSAEDDTSLPDQEPVTFESYQCTGDLEQDFTMLCTLVGYTVIPKVISHPPPQPALPAGTPVSERIADDFDVASQKSGQSEKSLKPEAATQSMLDLIEARYSSLKPSVHVEWENRNGKLYRKISVRGWKIEEKMIAIFAKCFPTVTDLYTISLWNVGFTDSTFSSFLTILPLCPGVKVFILDGNPLPQQSYYKLISDDLQLTYISLRNNQIDDEGARLISQALQGLSVANKSLASLVLSFNHISDAGARYLAEALRLNRSLLVLNLSSNRIGDKGALALAEVLGHFALTHEELVERRRILMEKAELEIAKLPLRSRHTESKSDRSQSHLSNGAMDKGQAKINRASPKKKEREPPKKEDKNPTKEPSKKDEMKPSASKESIKKEEIKASASKESTKRDETKHTKKQASNNDIKNARSRTLKSASKNAVCTESEPEEVTPTENINPLLEPAKSSDGKVYIPGNKALIDLNLLRNKITDIGLRGFLTAIETQVQEMQLIPGTNTPTGLLRLSIQKNNFPVDSETFMKIQELMQGRDPLRKTSTSSVEVVVE